MRDLADKKMNQITCKNLSVGYDNKTVAASLNFEINEGDYLCIVGENGSGKSTLMKTILGLLPAIGGEVIFAADFNRREIGYLPQQVEIQRDFPASVREIVLSGFQGRCALRPFYCREERTVAQENLERVSISDLSGKCYRELSGGQQQRVLLARALCASNKMLFLDEPVSGLDPHATSQMYEIVADINKTSGTTVVMISHEIEEALKFSSHILHLGKSVYFGSCDGYLTSKVGQDFVRDNEGVAK